MSDIYDFFAGNPWLNILFLILSIVGIYLTFVFYYKALKNKVPVYSLKTTNLIDSNISTIKNIEITYNGQLLKNLSLSKICIWNAGKEPIRRIDIAPSDPLIIYSPDGIIIYDFEILHQNIVNDIKLIKRQENEIEISFEFLDYNNGVSINIYHSGKSDNDIKIAGTLIGAKKIAYGINEEVLVNKLNVIFTPVDYLTNHKFKMVKVLSFFVALPIIAIAFPILFIVGPIDFISDKITKKKVPAEFYVD